MRRIFAVVFFAAVMPAILKSSGLIDWPWLWVLAPAAGAIVFFAVVLVIFGAVAGIGSTRYDYHNQRRG